MAAGTKLVLTFDTSDGKTAQFSYSYAQPNAGLANVKALMAAMITNTAVYDKTLVTAKSAKEVTTSENIYDLDETVNMTEDTGEDAEITKIAKYDPYTGKRIE